MDGQGGSVRRNIALKLRGDQGPVIAPKVQQPEPKKEDTTTVTASDKATPATPTVSSSKKVPINVVLRSGEDLQWDQKIHLVGRCVKDPAMHICESCSLPVLIYGRMKHCRHAFCRDCAKKATGTCPKCKESGQIFEEAAMGGVYICTHGGGRYDNKGCGRSYLSQRDLDAHILYRHSKDKPLAPPLQPPGLKNPMPSFPIAFFQPGMVRPDFIPPPGLPPGFPSAAIGLPPGAALQHQGIRPPMAPPNTMAVGIKSTLSQATPPVGNVPPIWSQPNIFSNK